MKIAIDVEGLAVAPQVLAYVEYRMFSAASRFGRECDRVGVRLEDCGSRARTPRYRCTVAVDLKPGGRVHVRAGGDGVSAVVDLAAARLVRRVEQRLSSGRATRKPHSRRSPSVVGLGGRREA
jgi:hypothetical protein